MYYGTIRTQHDPASDNPKARRDDTDTLKQVHKRLDTEWWTLAYANGLIACFNFIALFDLIESSPNPRTLKIIFFIGNIVAILGMYAAFLLTVVYSLGVYGPRFMNSASVDEDGNVHLELCMDYRGPRVFTVCAIGASVLFLHIRRLLDEGFRNVVLAIV